MPQTAYRLVKTQRIDEAFSGEGARRYGGRWNSPGQPCTYLSQTEALAILEVLVHLRDYRILNTFALLRLELPDEAVVELEEAELPPNWREDPAPGETASIGDAWLNANASLALRVPSTIAPRDCNLMLNPFDKRHDEVVTQARRLPFSPDPRLAQ